jgi:hypothetical protein
LTPHARTAKIGESTVRQIKVSRVSGNMLSLGFMNARYVQCIWSRYGGDKKFSFAVPSELPSRLRVGSIGSVGVHLWRERCGADLVGAICWRFVLWLLIGEGEPCNLRGQDLLGVSAANASLSLEGDQPVRELG